MYLQSYTLFLRKKISQKKILKLSHQSHHCQAEAEVQTNYFNKVCKGI